MMPSSPSGSANVRSAAPSNEAESLRKRLFSLEEAAAKAWGDRAEFEGRLNFIERERAVSARATAHAFESIAANMKELSTTILELPSAPAMRATIEQLEWLGSDKSAGRTQLQDLVIKMDGRLAELEEQIHNSARRMASTETRLVESAQTFAERCEQIDLSKAEKIDHDRLGESLREWVADTRSNLDSKADKRDADRLAEALNQSYREFTANVLKNRHEVVQLERNCTDLGNSLSTLDDACRDLKKSFVQRQEEANKSPWTNAPETCKPSVFFPTAAERQDECVDNSTWKSWTATPNMVPMPPGSRQQGGDSFQRRMGSTPVSPATRQQDYCPERSGAPA